MRVYFCKPKVPQGVKPWNSTFSMVWKSFHINKLLLKKAILKFFFQKPIQTTNQHYSIPFLLYISLYRGNSGLIVPNRPEVIRGGKFSCHLFSERLLKKFLSLGCVMVFYFFGTNKNLVKKYIKNIFFYTNLHLSILKMVDF